MERKSSEVKQESPGGEWWKKPHLSKWIVDRGREPTSHELFMDYIVKVIMRNPKVVEVASTPPSRLIRFNIKHPKRGVEYIRLFLNPTDLREGRGDEEPDLIIRMGYYDLLAFLSGGADLMEALWNGRILLTGNVTAALDLFDLIQVSQGKPRTSRPDFWPEGHP